MIISLIVAMDENRGIGIANGLPWRLPADLKRFKALTLGHYIVMGRKTYQSIGRNLPGRISIVITRQPDYKPENCQPGQCIVTHSIESALEYAREQRESEVFILGGGEIFAQTLHLAERIYLTQVHTVAPADTFFPKIVPGDWIEQESQYHLPDERNPLAFTWKVLVKNT